MSFVPFPTSLLAEYLDGKALNAAAAFYCGTFILISIGYNLVWRSMVRGDLLKPEVSAAHVRKISRPTASACPCTCSRPWSRLRTGTSASP